MVQIDQKELEDIIDHLENLEVPYKYLKVIHRYFMDKLDESLHVKSEAEGGNHLGLVPPYDIFKNKY